MAAQVSTRPTRPSLASAGPVLTEPSLGVRGTPWFSAQTEHGSLSRGQGGWFGVSVFKPGQTVCGEEAGRPTSSHRACLPITDGEAWGAGCPLTLEKHPRGPLGLQCGFRGSLSGRWGEGLSGIPPPVRGWVHTTGKIQLLDATDQRDTDHPERLLKTKTWGRRSDASKPAHFCES